MSLVDADRPLLHVALGIAFVSGLLSVAALVRLDQLSHALPEQSRGSVLSELPPTLNAAIDARIDEYLDRQQQARIDARFEPYALAPERTRGADHVYGSEQARFTLIEYADIECAFCRRYHEVPKILVDAGEGKVNWQWRHLFLDAHNPMALIQAQATECAALIAGNRAFWVYLEALFVETKGKGQGVTDLVGLAHSLGIDREALAACVDNGDTYDRVMEDIRQAQAFGFHSTPVTLIIDNLYGRQQILQGLQSPEALVAAIRRLAHL